MKNIVILAIIATLIGAANANYISVPKLPEKHYKHLEEFNFGAMLPIHRPSLTDFCDERVRDLGQLQRLEAVAFAVDEINSKTDILPNTSLGFVIYDDCYKDITALAQSLHFVEHDGFGACYVETAGTCEEKDNIAMYDVIGVIGTEGSSMTTQVANLLTSFSMPHISYLSTSPKLADRARYPHFFRTVPSDTHQARAIIELCKHFNWTYVSVIYSEGDYGSQAYRELAAEASKSASQTICFAQVYEIKRNFLLGDFNNILYAILMEKAKAVIVVTDVGDARQILAAAHRLKEGGRITWIASDAWARDRTEIRGYEEVASGLLSFNIARESVPRFDEFFAGIRPTAPEMGTGNPWIDEFWLYYFGCTNDPDVASDEGFPLCAGNLSFAEHQLYVPDKSVPLVLDAIYALAHGLHSLLYDGGRCNYVLNKNVCVRKLLSTALNEVSFQGEDNYIRFDEAGSVGRNYVLMNVRNESDNYEMVQVGVWDYDRDMLNITNDIYWAQGETPESYCSVPCGIGENQILQAQRCCWVCEPCPPNEYTSLWYGQQRCFPCLDNQWPDEATRTTCLPIVPTYLRWHDVLGIVLCSMAATGLAATVVTLGLFITNNTNPLIKSSSRELSYILLVSLLLSYALVFTFLFKPDDVVCTIRLMGYSLCFTLMYAPLLTKTIRILRIFESGRKMNRKPSCVSSKSQIGITANLVLLHVLIVTGWTIASNVRVEETGTAPDIELVCIFPIPSFVTSLAYNGVLLFACVVCAFKTRHLPANFNESKFISFCVCSTVVIQLAFSPAYFAVGKAYYEVLFLSLSVLTNATLILICIFIPKVYALYFVNKDNLHVYPKFRIRSGALRIIDNESSNSESNMLSKIPASKHHKRNVSDTLELKLDLNSPSRVSPSKMANGHHGTAMEYKIQSPTGTNYLNFEVSPKNESKT